MRRFTSLIASLFMIAIILSRPVHAGVFTVRSDGSGDFDSIAAAASAAVSGDTIEVGPGTYQEPSIFVHTKTLTFISTDGADSTVIDGQKTTQIFDYYSSTISIEGFGFTHGFDSRGGAIYIHYGSSVEVRDCHFLYNNASLGASAIMIEGSGSSAQIANCYFFRNGPTGNNTVTVSNGAYASIVNCTFTENYGAVLMNRASVDIVDCLIFRNWGWNCVSFGSDATGTMQSCTLDSNMEAVTVQEGSGVDISYNIISNTISGYGLLYTSLYDEGPHSCNIFWNNANGPIWHGTLGPDEVVADPLFCDPYNSDYTVANASPALPANNTCGQIGPLGMGCIIPISSQPKVITVDGSGPADFDNIPEAVEAALFGDTIEVAPGTYTGTINVRRPVIFRSTDGSAATILDGEGTSRIMNVINYLDVTIDGFTFANGNATGEGGALQSNNLRTITITNCDFVNNVAGGYGGAIKIKGTVEVTNCRFENNLSSSPTGKCYGGGACVAGQSRFIQCEFKNNSACAGGAISTLSSYYYYNQLTVSECLFAFNSSSSVGAIFVGLNSSGSISNSTFYGNESPNSGTIAASDELVDCDVSRCILAGDIIGYALVNPTTTSCNVLWDNAAGSILDGVLDSTDVVSDPMFCDGPAGDFTLAEASPAAAANSVCGELIGAFPVGCTEVSTFVSSFYAEPSAESVALSWEIGSDEIVLGFLLHRFDPHTKRNTVLPTDGLLDASLRYYVDEEVQPGSTYQYFLVVVLEGQDNVLSPPIRVAIPSLLFSLDQNFPNPFNPVTTISYGLAEGSDVRLEVFSVTGRRVRTLVDARQPAGAMKAFWDGRNDAGQIVASGVYFYRLRAGEFRAIRKMIFMK